MLNEDRIDVLIAHGNPLVAAGLAAAFRDREDFRIVAWRGLDELPQLPCACVTVTDLECGTRMMAAHQAGRCRVLILTDDESEVSIRCAVGLGVNGYLPLSSGVDSVVNAVRCIRDGGTAIAPSVMTRMAMSLRSRPLTERQLDVLRLIMQGLPDKAIARRLERSVGTAKSHVKAILTKLDASSRVEAVVVARRRGLVAEKSMALPGP